VKVACQQACPTSAIVFGNVNDKKSAISEVRNGKTNLVYHALEQLHALPSVSYLAKIRNTDRHVGVENDAHAAAVLRS
jgi:Fe-S-cluster-containing dehydrogenase component